MSRRRAGVDPTAVTPTDLLTIPETAREMRVSVRTVYRLIAEKKLIPTRGSAHLRIERSTLREYYASRRTAA